MKNFDLLMPKSLEQALSVLPEKDWSEARVLAGGMDLVPELKDHVTEAGALVNLKSIPAKAVDDAGFLLVAVTPGPTSVEIGALVTVAGLASGVIARTMPFAAVLEQAAASVASPQIRSVATLGGNLCQRPRCWYYRNEGTVCLKKGGTECFSYGGRNKYNAILGGGPSYIVHPSDLAPALIALDATVTLHGPAGERQLLLEDFYTLPESSDVTRENVLAPNEILTRVEIPTRGEDWRSTYQKFKERESYDFALSAVALALRMDGDTIAEARLVLGGVAPRPWRCASTEKLLVGRKNDDDAARAAGEDALRLAEPLSENGYKVPLTKGLIVKAMRALRA